MPEPACSFIGVGAMASRMRWPEGFIAVDWGTTNRRAYRVDASGQCSEEFEDDKGVLSIADGGFPFAVAEVRQRLGDHPLLLAGMVGSNRGWVEAPYVPCPAGIDELARSLAWAGEREAIVPGVCYLRGDRADVMRGEEVQVLGAASAGLIDPLSLVCHPGTHNKWSVVRRGHIQSFRTVMTGELFNLLKKHSILADQLTGEVEVNDAFRAGVRQGLSDDSLPAELFSIRARVLLGQARREDGAAYASGLLIGTDVRIGLSDPAAAQIVVMGRPELTRLYAAAIGEAGRAAIELDGEKSFLAGIAEIAKRI
jgi:2-dehydro-3-deoxygalactonokinase